MTPESAGSSPARTFKSVDFPLPLTPRSPTRSPSSSVTAAPSNNVVDPYAFARARALRTVTAASQSTFAGSILGSREPRRMRAIRPKLRQREAIETHARTHARALPETSGVAAYTKYALFASALTLSGPVEVHSRQKMRFPLESNEEADSLTDHASSTHTYWSIHCRRHCGVRRLQLICGNLHRASVRDLQRSHWLRYRDRGRLPGPKLRHLLRN